MSYYNLSYFKEKGQAETFYRAKTKSISNQKSIQTYDIFLSHSFKDKYVVSGIYKELSDLGFDVYVDWIVDGEFLDRENVDKETAERLRDIMKNSKSLVFATSKNSLESNWTPWELGYMDARTNKCALLPIKESSNDSFEGIEYFKLYPVIDKAGFEKNPDKEQVLWLNYKAENAKQLKLWFN